ncbi:hypothetical protein [Tissierella praeacuta]|uniref:Phosphate-starvation-inducible E n=1 Tax=Tissierella praeacuta DSM 18095 TaxID=1123404 RepID=A0A1M4UFW1_9FIRM|nr:hypothetical protein [Tissierella praeacuta]MBU5255744.1 hypothetical protein [Tissierella praeacuta]TCU77183.1 hypothetical protein EV204_10241 [Tissierella praeacuta]SHE55460.1 hypothetical protein SAMN02745784_01056 [Tissierella praeacuta DSM 18095]SUP03904.1 Uncharacterised protein [Tissierella praeacuta]
MQDELGNLLKKLEKAMKNFILWIEILLAAFIIVTVILSGKDIIVLIHKVFMTEASASYEILQGLLTHILLLVVGLELALMLITHSAGNVLEVILYAIARKMLISSSNTMDILLGVISLAIIFAVDKYLHTRDVKRLF